jgi:hypothetical protein
LTNFGSFFNTLARFFQDVGCIRGNGYDYAGSANRGESGAECLPWDSPHLDFVLDRPTIDALKASGNRCRNPDNDTAPWCVVASGEFDYCDIDNCERSDKSSPTLVDDLFGRCRPNQFQCRPGECTLAEYICDGTRLVNIIRTMHNLLNIYVVHILRRKIVDVCLTYSRSILFILFAGIVQTEQMKWTVHRNRS